MNFKRRYKHLINKVQLQNRHKDTSRYEEHHIFPLSLDGGHEKENRIFLTFREHYIAHHMLSKIYKGNKELAHAFWAMNNQLNNLNNNRDYKINSRFYAESKQKISHILKGNKYHLGFKNTQETKDLMSKQATGVHNYRFKGYFITPWGKFNSSNQQSKVSGSILTKWCKDCNTLILSKRRYQQNKNLFNEKDIGKTMSQLGFSFEKAERIIPKRVTKDYISPKGKDHWNYKRVRSEKTKQKLKEASTGENNPWFKGYYITPFGKFPSLHGAKQKTGYCMSNWFKENYCIKLIHTSKYPYLFKQEDIGKTFISLGYRFEPI